MYGYVRVLQKSSALSVAQTERNRLNDTSHKFVLARCLGIRWSRDNLCRRSCTLIDHQSMRRGIETSETPQSEERRREDNPLQKQRGVQQISNTLLYRHLYHLERWLRKLVRPFESKYHPQYTQDTEALFYLFPTTKKQCISRFVFRKLPCNTLNIEFFS